MHSIEDLYNLTEKPILSKISLKLLQEYYKEYLMPYKFTYSLNNNQKINLVFNDSNFCHLLGIETVAEAKFGKNRKLTSKYRGVTGYKNISNQNITFKTLKGLSPVKFKSIKDKLIFFYLLPHLLESSKLFIEYKHDPSVSFVQCKFLIYDMLHGSMIHLGIEIENGTNFFPRTFLIERITQFNDGTRFINNQNDEIEVQEITITKRFSNTPAQN